MRTISTFEAKNRLSELLAAASKGEPQVITKNGVETAVIVSYDEFRRLTARQQSLNEFLLAAPLRNSRLKIERSKDAGRAAPDFDRADAEEGDER